MEVGRETERVFEGQAARGDFQAVKQRALDDVNGESEVMVDWWGWRGGTYSPEWVSVLRPLQICMTLLGRWFGPRLPAITEQTLSAGGVLNQVLSSRSLQIQTEVKLTVEILDLVESSTGGEGGWAQLYAFVPHFGLQMAPHQLLRAESLRSGHPRDNTPLSTKKT